jgi:hypothetical protein
MTGEPRHSDRFLVDRAAAQDVDRAPRGKHLRGDVAAFPRDEPATDGQEGERELDELGQRSNRASRHGRPALAVAGLGGEFLGSSRRHAHPRREAGDLDCGGQERRLLADRIDERDALEGKRSREGDAGKAAAAAEVNETVDIAQHRDGRQAVDDVAEGDVDGLPDRCQVDRGVPGEEQSDVVVDRLAADG